MSATVTIDCFDRAVDALFARRPEHMVPGLERIGAVCRALGHPERTYPCVHVTGTNGKTSTARMVTALLVAAGHRVGTSTSPHLQDVRERILVDGMPVSRDMFLRAHDLVADATARVESELGQMVTFFESLTALGATCFRDQAVDVGVIEVGMGGRWDATNVHDGAVAVIGTVGLDHPELGATVAAIAQNKAGIIKDGAAVVMAPQPPAAERVIAAEAAARSAQLIRMGEEVQVLERRCGEGGQAVRVRLDVREFTFHLPLLGAHQAVNAAVALAATDALLAGGLDPDTARAGFARAVSAGRLEVVPRAGGATVVLDGAHNPDGARALAAAIRESFPGRRVVGILGVLADKDLDGVVGALLEVMDDVVVIPPPSVRAPSASNLAAAVRRHGHGAQQADDIEEALRYADAVAASSDLVLVAGSIYLVGAARDALGLRDW